MNSKLIITRENDRIMTYYMQDNKLVTVQAEYENTTILQNIYVGKVKNIVRSLNAAFIEVQPGIKCYLSLKDCEKPIICNLHHANKTLAEGDDVIVQVSKDAIKTKDPAVTTKLSYAGKYAVISYPNTKIGFSNKLSQNEKKKLKKMAAPFLDADFGYVIRTSASIFANTDTIEDSNQIRESDTMGINSFQQELLSITEILKEILKVGRCRTPYSLLYQAPPKYLKNIKNLSDKYLSNIITDDSKLYNGIKNYLLLNQQEDLVKLTKYEDTTFPLNKLYRLETLLNDALYKNVWLKSGGYLVIEPTEALTVIDVNSGKCTNKKDMEDTFHLINIEAATEIARQLRLRNLSGMILIDFINVQSRNHKAQLMQILRENVKKDPVRTNVIDMTALGLVEVTRKKIESPLHEQMKNKL